MDGINNNYRRVHRITIVNKSLILSDKNKQELAKYAESEKPYESCAILIGNEEEKNWIVKKLFLIPSMGVQYTFIRIIQCLTC
jgi:hypothetical protein